MGDLVEAPLASDLPGYLSDDCQVWLLDQPRGKETTTTAGRGKSVPVQNSGMGVDFAGRYQAGCGSTLCTVLEIFHGASSSAIGAEGIGFNNQQTTTSTTTTNTNNNHSSSASEAVVSRVRGGRTKATIPTPSSRASDAEEISIEVTDGLHRRRVPLRVCRLQGHGRDASEEIALAALREASYSMELALEMLAQQGKADNLLNASSALSASSLSSSASSSSSSSSRNLSGPSMDPLSLPSSNHELSTSQKQASRRRWGEASIEHFLHAVSKNKDSLREIRDWMNAKGGSDESIAVSTSNAIGVSGCADDDTMTSTSIAPTSSSAIVSSANGPIRGAPSPFIPLTLNDVSDLYYRYFQRDDEMEEQDDNEEDEHEEGLRKEGLPSDNKQIVPSTDPHLQVHPNSTIAAAITRCTVRVTPRKWPASLPLLTHRLYWIKVTPLSPDLFP